MINEKLKHNYYDNILCLLKKCGGKSPAIINDFAVKWARAL